MQQQLPRLEAIERAVHIRELGRTDEAISILMPVVESCTELSDLADARGELAVCYKHKFQKTKDRQFLQKLGKVAMAGMLMNILEVEKAKFNLRMGDYCVLAGETPNAGAYYRRAHELVVGTTEEAEYAGHLAEYLAMVGEIEEASSLVSEALWQLHSREKAFEPKHYLIIKSGVYARKVGIDLAAKDYKAATESFLHGYTLAWRLAWYHWYPERRRQYHQAILDKLLRRR